MDSVREGVQKPLQRKAGLAGPVARVKIQAPARYLTVSRNSKRLSRAKLRVAFRGTHVVETTAGWLVARFDYRGIRKEFTNKEDALKYACRISAPKEWPVILHKKKIDRDRFFDRSRAAEVCIQMDPQ